MNVRVCFRATRKRKLVVSMLVAWCVTFSVTAGNWASAAQSQTPAAKTSKPAKTAAKKTDPKETKATPKKAKPRTVAPKKTSPKQAVPEKKTPIAPKDADAAERAKLDPALRERIDSIIGEKAANRLKMAKQRAAQGQPAPVKERATQLAPQSGRPSLPMPTDPSATAPTTALDIPGGIVDIPPEQRSYAFSIKDGTYEQLLDAFARMTDLAVLGDVPKDGKVTFVSDEELTFKEAFGRVRLLLFRYKPHEPYWMLRRETHLEVIRVNDFYRILPRERMYRSVDEFAAAKLPDDELALVIFTPKSGSISNLKAIRDFLPDYVRVAPLNATSITLFALVKDINKYLELVELLVVRQNDPRPIERIELEFILPSKALELLRQLTVLDESKQRVPSRGRIAKDVSALETMPEPEVTLVPDDAMGVLIVRAMQDKIDSIKAVLPFIDVDDSVENHRPIVIPVEHADAGELVATIQQILNAYTPTATPGVPPAQRAGRRVRIPKRGTAKPLTADGVTMLVHPAGNAIIVIADEEEVKQVQELIHQFDVSGRVGPLRIDLANANAEEVITAVNTIITGGAPKVKAPGTGFHLVAGLSGKAIWYSGTEKDLAQVRDIIAQLDVVGRGATLRIITLQHETPVFVADMLRALDQESLAIPTTPSAVRGKRPTASVGASKFTASDEQNRLYVFCTDEDWEQYEPIIAQLEAEAKARVSYERIAVEHIDPLEAVERLATMIAGNGPASAARLVAAEDGVLVMAPSPAVVSEVRSLLMEIDLPSRVIRRMFELKHRDPAEITAAVEALMGLGGSAAPSRIKQVVKGAGVSVGVAQPDITIVHVGRNLVVHATPTKMEKIAMLIAELDVAESETRLTIYEDFQPQSDIVGIAEALTSVFSGSPSGLSKARQGGAMEGPRFIPQPAFGRLIVIAPVDMLEEIEEFLDAINGSVDATPIVIEFVDVVHMDADVLAALISPLLELQIQELLDNGLLTDKSASVATPGKVTARRPAPGGNLMSTHFHLVPDVGNDRLVVAAAQVVVDRVRELVAKFDTPHEEGEVVFRTVKLAQADSADMVRAVREMKGRPVRRAPTKIPGSASSVVQATEPKELVVAEAPGGGAVILHGVVVEVEEATEWIKALDAISGRDREIKVYEISHADIKLLVDMIMVMVDRPSPARPTPGKPVRPRRATDAVEEKEDEFELTKTWTGTDLYIHADLIDGTMVVAAPAAKLKKIDDIVAQFDSEDNPIFEPPLAIPSFMYELKYAEAFDAEFELQALLDQLWNPPDEVPQVESALFGNFLIIKYPRKDRFGEIEEFIRKYVDKPDPDDLEFIEKPLKLPLGVTPTQLAQWLKDRFPGAEVDIVDVSEVQGKATNIEQLGPMSRDGSNPCVLPLALTRLAENVLASVTLQASSDRSSTGDKEQEAPADSSSDLDEAAGRELLVDVEPARGKKLTFKVDDKTGNIRVEGAKIDVEKIPELLEDLEKDLEKIRMPPDIRIFRLRYINVYEATEIIEEMFNATRQQLQAVQLAQRQAQQRAVQLQRQRQLQAQQQQKGQQPEQQQRGQPEQPQAQTPQLPEQAVRVYPNPRDRTLILRAETNQYPALLELIATIDQPKPIDSKLRIFKLDKLNAVEVETMLSDMLDLDQGTPRAAAPTAGRPGRATARRSSDGSRTTAGGQLPQTIMQETVGGTNRLGVDPQDIKLSSNEASNTILVMAPQAAIDFVGKLIKQLESEEIPERLTRHYNLKHAGADEVADYLVSQFNAKGGGGSRLGRPGAQGAPVVASPAARSLNTPSFISYPRLNLLTVLATDEQFPRIDELIALVDVRSELEEWQSVTLQHADAKTVADTLTAMFGSGGGGARGGKPGAAASGGGDARFIGEEGGRTLLFSAGVSMKDSILTAIENLETDAKSATSIRVLTLKFAAAGQVATALKSAFDVGRGVRGGAGKTRFTITPHDASRQLFVQSDDATFAEIETLVAAMDKPGGFIGDFRFYRLQHADAKNVHTLMTKLIADYVKRLPQEARNSMEAFSVEFDESTNSLIVLGSPVVFGFIEENLAKIDNPANAASPISVMMVALKTADAQEVAGNINRLWMEKGAATGKDRAQAEANRSLNMLIVRGPQDQLDEIKIQFIDPMQEQSAPALLTETIDLQFADPEAIAETINEVFEARRRAVQGLGARGSTVSPLEFTVVVTPQASTKQVVVQASEHNMAQIKDWVTEFDREDIAEKLATTVKIYPIKFVDTDAVVRIISEWCRSRPQSSGKGQSKEVCLATSEPMTQSIVVTSSHANHVIIKGMIDGLEGSEIGRQEVHVINLQNADAESVSRVLGEIFVRSAPRSTGGVPPISISAVQGSKAVLVKCKDEMFADIQAVVDELDTQEAVLGETVSVVALLYAEASEVEAALRTYITPPGGGGRGKTELVGDTRLSILSQSNALVLSGDKESVERLEQLAKQLDLSGEKGSVPQIIKLKHASASQLAPTLEEMFVEQRGGKQGKTPTIIKPNEAIGALIVRASPTEFAAIEAIIKELDTEDALPGDNFRIVQVGAGLNVTDVSAKVEEAINQGSLAQYERGKGGASAPSIRVTPDTRTQSLIVSGSPQLFEQAAAMAKQLEDLGPPGGKAVKIITLSKTPADDVERLIALLKGEGATGGSGSAPRRPRTSRRRGN